MSTEDMDTETEHERETEEPRIRQLTEKASDVYRDRVKHCTVELSILWDRVDHVIQCIDKNKDNLDTLQEVEKKLTHNIENFDKYTDSFGNTSQEPEPKTASVNYIGLIFLKKDMIYS